jgi:hypothetical protein
LNDGRSIADVSAANDVSDLQFDQVATAQFAVDRHVEQRPVTHSPVLIKIEADRPDIARLQWAFRADVLACIPGTPFVHSRVKV